MNGAESLVKTLVKSGVEVCFANPGTSEMHFVSALDKTAGIRCVLGLFEGVVTGAADGYARMADKPAVTLLHLGPGLGNGFANLHNARKARTPVVNIIGEHALWHIEHDAPLTADIEGIARPVSHWVKTSQTANDVAADAAQAVSVARGFPGNIASLILPANTAWEQAQSVATAPPSLVAATVPEIRIEQITEILDNDEPTAIILGGSCVRADALELASKLSQRSGATLFSQTSNARLQRGAGRVNVRSIPYPVDQAIELLQPFQHLVLVNAKAPVAFFAYPGKPSQLSRSDAQIHTLADTDEDGLGALRQVVDNLGASKFHPALQERILPPIPVDGALNVSAINTLLARHIPENAIIVDEAITSGRDTQAATVAAEPHDWLQICGGSIGDGFPLATGAAVACPDRRVIALQADGSGMYTLQALWTQAREALDITTIIYSNQSYAILQHELKNVEADSGEVAQALMRLDSPTLNWTALAQGMGVEASKATTVRQFESALQSALKRRGPFLIEAVID